MMTQNSELDALCEIAQLFARRASLRELAEQALDLLETRLGMRYGAATLELPEEQRLTVEAPSVIHAAAIAAGDGCAAGQLGVPDAPGEYVSVCVPMVMGHEVIGTLTVDLPGGAAGGLEAGKKVLAAVAGLLASAVRNRQAARQERAALETENRRLLGALQDQFRPDALVGHSRPLREVCQRIHQVSNNGTIPVLIRGEAGTGKELVAATIHYHSPRAEGPFVRMSCAALNEDLIESELFGFEKTADSPFHRPGRVEEAEGGTLFLDEIGELTPALQVKLLRLVQDGQFERAGSLQSRRANVRLVAATRRDLEAAVRQGAFRQDLYYRIGVFPILLAPLRERDGDILLLANHFVAQYAARLGKAVRRISTPAINMLMAYHWPGNVRELESCIEHAILMSTDEVIHGHNLPPTLQIPDGSEAATAGTLKQAIHALERDMIVDALKRSGGSISAASRELGITGRMVRYKIKQFEIDYRGLFSRRAQSARAKLHGSEAA